MPDTRLLLGAVARVLVVRLGSLGDIVHTLPAVAALRESFPKMRMDWLVERRWRPLLDKNPVIDNVLDFERGSWGGMIGAVARLRSARYHCAIDFQGLYKSAVFAYLSGAPLRLGYDRQVAREGGAARFYTHRHVPSAAHIVDQHLELAGLLGAQSAAPRFPLRVDPAAATFVQRELFTNNVSEYYALAPGGGWRSKCWPAEQYGHLHRRLAERHGWRGMVIYGPGERALAEAVRLVAGEPEPILIPFDLPQLVAALDRARFLVAGDTGPLHLAAALGRPVVGLYGPTDPKRNGPYGRGHVVIRNAVDSETTYKRGADYSPAMLSIKVDQVIEAVDRVDAL